MSLNIQTTFQTVEESEAHQEAPLSSFIITKSQVTKAGSTIRNYVLSQGPNSESVQLNVEEEFKNALVILKRFREIYSPYLKLLESLLERKLKRLGLFDDSFIAARTKRLESITNKLLQRTSMRLPQMEDIVGIRVTLPNMESLNIFIADLSDCEIVNSECISKAFTVNDYIATPKDDGYRSVHHIFKCSTDTGFEIKLELQIRTKIQHEWATVVEILGTLNKQSYKAGQGDEKTLGFLRLTSVLFSFSENTPVISAYKELTGTEVSEHLNALDNELKVIDKLKEVSSLIQSNESSESSYYLIKLDIKNHVTEIVQYNDENEANDKYVILERKYQNSDRFDVVLVSIDDFKKIKDAYPNYFLNANDFVDRFVTLIEQYS